MAKNQSSGGCLTGFLIPLIALMIVGFWPLIFFSHLPWILRVPAWILWLIFLGSGLALAWRKFPSRRYLPPFRRSRYVSGEVLQVSPEEAFSMLEEGVITPREYEEYLAWRAAIER